MQDSADLGRPADLAVAADGPGFAFFGEVLAIGDQGVVMVTAQHRVLVFIHVMGKVLAGQADVAVAGAAQHTSLHGAPVIQVHQPQMQLVQMYCWLNGLARPGPGLLRRLWRRAGPITALANGTADPVLNPFRVLR